MKKFLIIGLVVASLAILIAGFNTPVFSQSPDDGETTPAGGETWETMHEACESGDWEAMTEAAEEVHGEDLKYMLCHGEDNDARAGGWSGMAGHMGGGGMMGW